MGNQSDPTLMAKAVLDIADEIERTELAIKEELLKAASNDDLERIKVNVTRWMNEPVSNVLADETR